MKRFLSKIQRAANQFSMVDFAIFKIYLVSVGILLGAYFAQFWLLHLTPLWIVAALSCIYVLIELVRLYLKK